MSKQVFALDAAATHRITIHWTTETDPASVLLNGTLLGTLTTGQEKVVGKDFVLPDNSPLHVRFFNGQPQAFRAGVALAPVFDEADVPMAQRKRGGCLTTWLILNLVVMVALTLLYFLATLGSLVNNNTGVSPLAFFLLAVMGIVGIVGISLLLAWKKLGFYLVAGYVLISIVISLIFGLIDGRTFTPLIGIVVLYFWLNRSGVWEKLS
ncbi:hypothetical protein [Dictyobacter kobayashii]|uniref:Uncharacterized protein n=1 Tax=Dictyobacter kobayashii TaxID=2014872 RepID=A0A402AVE3_9CHLR|nr:hypothetical protein [Dictyobacter kobayashii]GCE23057.1 hypothetical protein KDK_68570 [Dictyobacter kobayashii]